MAGSPEIPLASLPVGSRLLVRSRKDWRFAAIARKTEERVVLTVCSPSGYAYRLRRDGDCIVLNDGAVYFLKPHEPDLWPDNFAKYDWRW